MICLNSVTATIAGQLDLLKEIGKTDLLGGITGEVDVWVLSLNVNDLPGNATPPTTPYRTKAGEGTFIAAAHEKSLP